MKENDTEFLLIEGADYYLILQTEYDLLTICIVCQTKITLNVSQLTD